MWDALKSSVMPTSE